MVGKNKLHYFVAIASVVAGSTAVSQAQLQVAGNLLVDVDATAVSVGALPAITNNGTLGGYFEARGGGTTIPNIGIVNGSGARGIVFDGDDYLQHVATLGGAPVSADPTLTGANPTCTVEVWVMNPGISREETMVAWGHRGADGRNMSFNYGWDARFGAVGHWGSRDIGWDSGSDADTNPPGVPKSGEWHHLVYTYDGTTQRIYADGVLKNSETINLDIFPVPAIVLGRQMDDDVVVSTGNAGSHTIARVRIHSEALSGSQVASNYAAEASQFAYPGSPLPFGPSHRYSFTNAPGAAANGSLVVDSIGGANGVVRGAGANFTGSRVSLPGGSSASAAYVDLPNGMLSKHSVDNGGSGGVTFEGWFKNTGNRNWARVFDFGSSDIDPTAAIVGGEITGPGGGGANLDEGVDYLFFTAQQGGNVNRREIDIRNHDPVQTPGAPDPAPVAYDHNNFNRDFHFALTWDEAAAQIVLYENGVRTGAMSVGTNRLSSINDVNVWLGRSNWKGDANTQGEYDEFRVYPRVLPPEQVRASYLAGPDSLATADPVSFVTEPQDQTIPEFGNVTFTVLAQGAPPLGVQWYKNGVPLEGSTGNSISFTSVPVSEHGATFYVIASNNIGGSSFYATSRVATLTVLADTNPPAVVQARQNTTTTLEVFFSEEVLAVDATVVGNYALSGPSAPNITAVAMGANNSVLLTIDGPLVACEFYTVTVTGVRDASAAGNATAAPNNSATLWTYALPGLTHRYNFNEAPSGNATGQTVNDLVGTAHGTVLNGSGTTTFTGSRLTLSGGASASAPYVDLPNGLLSTNSVHNGGSGQVTFEGWVKVTGNRGWSRIFDFGFSTAGELNGPGGAGDGVDYVFYSAQNGGNVNTHTVVVRDVDPLPDGTSTGSDTFVDISTATFNTDLHFAFTWDEATGQVRVYENGVQVGAFSTTAQMSDIHDVNVWLGRSNWTGDQNMQGEFDEFRIYNSVLTASQIALNKSGGPDNYFGAPLSVDLVLTNVNLITNTVRSAQVLVHFSNAGTQNVAGANCVTYSSSDSNIVVLTADGIVRAFNEGTATLTATLGGVSDSIEVTVVADTTPPEFLSVRPLNLRTLELQFSEPLSPGSATEPSNFYISGPSGQIVANSSILSADNTRVILGLSSDLPCEYIDVYVEGMYDVVGQFMIPTTLSFMHYLPAGLAHRYNFNNRVGEAGNATVWDSLSTGDGVVRGSGGTFTGTRVTLPGGSSASAAYVDLPNGLLSVNSTNNGGSGEVTLEGWFRHTGNFAWGRIFDFGSTGTAPSPGGEIGGPGGGGEGIDYFMLSAQIGTDINARRFEINNRDQSGLGAVVNDYFVNSFSNDVHFLVTWNEKTGQLRSYENGVLVGQMSTVAAMSDINDVNVWLGRSMWTADQNLQGEFDEFRVYNRIVGTNEMAMNAFVGPDYNFGQPQALRFSATNFMVAGQSQQAVVEVDFANFADLDITPSACYTINASNPSVISNSPSGVLYAVGSGTADVTVSFSGLSSSTITITVNAAPIGGDDGITTAVDVPVTVDFATLLANDNDPDGNLPLSVTVSSTSTNGGAITVTETNLTYTPATGYAGSDLFTYTVTDSLGASDVVNVFVYVSAGPLPELNHVAAAQTGHGFNVTFRGTPGTTYEIQRTTDLTQPITWTTISTQVAPPTGIIGLNDTESVGGQAFYRVISQ